MNPQLELVEEAVFEQESRDVPEAVLHDVATGVVLEIADPVDDTCSRSTSVLFHSGSVSVVETTTLCMLLMRSE